MLTVHTKYVAEDKQIPNMFFCFCLFVYLFASFQGCYPKVLDLLKRNLLIIGIVGIVVAVIQVSPVMEKGVLLEVEGITRTWPLPQRLYS